MRLRDLEGTDKRRGNRTDDQGDPATSLYVYYGGRAAGGGVHDSLRASLKLGLGHLDDSSHRPGLSRAGQQ